MPPNVPTASLVFPLGSRKRQRPAIRDRDEPHTPTQLHAKVPMLRGAGRCASQSHLNSRHIRIAHGRSLGKSPPLAGRSDGNPTDFGRDQVSRDTDPNRCWPAWAQAHSHALPRFITQTSTTTARIQFQTIQKRKSIADRAESPRAVTCLTLHYTRTSNGGSAITRGFYMVSLSLFGARALESSLHPPSGLVA